MDTFRKWAVWIETHQRRILWLLVLGVLIAGGVYTAILGDTLRFLPDEADYVQLADNLASQGRYTLDGVAPSAFRAPGYPVLLSAIRILGGGLPAQRYANFLLLAASLALVYKILRTQAPSLGPLSGALLVIAYPVLFFTAGALYPQTLAAFLLLLCIYWLLRIPHDTRSAVAAGFSLGALVMTIPTFLYLLVLVPIWLWRSHREIAFRRLGVMLLIAWGMIGLWTARNMLALNTFVPLTTNTGINLLFGNSEFTTPTAGTVADISKYESIGEKLPEVARDRYYRSQAVNFIRADIPAALQLYFLKTLNFFNFRNRLDTQGESSAGKDLMMLLTYGMLLGFTILRLLQARTHPLTPLEVLLLSLYLLSAPIHAVFFTRIRFRLPFDYALILLAGQFVGIWASRRFGTSSSPAA